MPHSILIVDDEPGIREALTSILSDEGYQATAVASGEECLARMREHPVDLVLLDVWLEGRSFSLVDDWAVLRVPWRYVPVRNQNIFVSQCSVTKPAVVTCPLKNRAT